MKKKTIAELARLHDIGRSIEGAPDLSRLVERVARNMDRKLRRRICRIVAQHQREQLFIDLPVY